jgi:hypothetical protein
MKKYYSIIIKKLEILFISFTGIGIKRADGTTAAEHFFSTQFPDLFQWLVGQMGELPLPRKGRACSIANSLKLDLCPALSG